MGVAASPSLPSLAREGGRRQPDSQTATRVGFWGWHVACSLATGVRIEDGHIGAFGVWGTG